MGEYDNYQPPVIEDEGTNSFDEVRRIDNVDSRTIGDIENVPESFDKMIHDFGEKIGGKKTKKQKLRKFHKYRY